MGTDKFLYIVDENRIWLDCILQVPRYQLPLWFALFPCACSNIIICRDSLPRSFRFCESLITWRSSVVVSALAWSTKLIYTGPG